MSCGDTNFCFSNENPLFFNVNYLVDNFLVHLIQNVNEQL